MSCIPQLLVQMHLRVPRVTQISAGIRQTGEIIAVNHTTGHFGAVSERVG